MKVIAIAAVGKNGVIGKGNDLPWDIPEDMRFFKDSTRDAIVLMGRKTLQSLGKPLPHRINAVITRDQGFQMDQVQVFHSIESAITYYKGNSSLSDKTLFVIGGAEIYKLSRAFLDEIWLTEIDADFEGDVYFPDYSQGELNLNSFERIQSKPKLDLNSPYEYRFSRFLKKK